MVARRAGVMLVLLIAAQGLLVIDFAGSMRDALAGEQQNEENGDNDKRHKKRGFLSDWSKKSPGETLPRKQKRLYHVSERKKSMQMNKFRRVVLCRRTILAILTGF